MNKRLEQEWKSYCDRQGAGTMISVNVKEVAQYFYSLALQDVRKEVDRLNEESCPAHMDFWDVLDHFRSFIGSLTK